MPFEHHIAVIAKNTEPAEAAGVGVYLGDSLLLTCAHVVNAALGRNIEDVSRPSGMLSVRFPSVSGQNLQAQIADGNDAWSSPPASLKSGADLCLLHLSGCQAPPAQLWEVETLIGRNFRTGGFPPDWRGDFDIAKGEIVGADGPLYMLRPNAESFAVLTSKPKTGFLSGEKRPAGLIHPGFSGSPVEVDGRIVGLVAEARVLLSEATAYMIPVSSLPSRIQRLRERGPVGEQPLPGSAPPIPPLFVGREDTIEALKMKLGISTSNSTAGAGQVITAVRGWPGVGKTSVAAALANDSEMKKALPDGVLWVSLGERPDLISAIANWGRRLGRDDVLRVSTVTEATDALAALLRSRQMLLVVDDVWETTHAEPFRRARGPRCILIFTTRLTTVAEALAPVPDAVFQIPVLTEENATKLFSLLAPIVAKDYPHEVHELVRDLEFLPLALQVAGHLANAEARRGWDVAALLAELRDGVQVLQATAPADRMDYESQTIPTVSVLLKQSVNRLPRSTQDYFAFLGAFAPKPATFDVAAMRTVWELDDPRPVVDMLIDRGLLEPVGNGRFQMHALLVALAKSLLLPEKSATG